ncbi:hypothetical protein [Pseudaminobacter sp. NGMCC 1.201702]|uniref:hypothetical protein n=1 Tax=Pseudaminobacter sp. NGMCC 1.201702 TaxID=3391825 RepID=UPI0039F01E36
MGEQFAGHGYVFAVHDPSYDPKEVAQGGKRPHIHAHAIITMRAEFGERIVTSPQVFREWRAVMAEKARDHGIDMELTDRRDQANPPAYTRYQVRPVSYAGRTEHEGTSEAAQVRYDAKRENTETSTTTERSRFYIAAAMETWRDLARNVDDKELARYAEQQLERINIAVRNLEKIPTNRLPAAHAPSSMVMLNTLGEIEASVVQQMTHSEFATYEKRVEAVLASLEANIGPSEPKDYDEIAAAARDVVEIRREYLELRERAARVPAEGRAEIDNEAWARWLARYGEQVVERGKDAVLEVGAVREEVDRVDETIASGAQDITERTTRSGELERAPCGPTEQHGPHLEELEREIEKRHERDDYER